MVTFDKTNTSLYPQEREEKVNREERLKETAEEIELKLISKIETYIRDIFDAVDEEVLEKVDMDYIADSTCEFVKNQCR